MSLFVIDVEADGPCPGLYSMISLGAVKVIDNNFDTNFYAELQPISEQWDPVAISIGKFTREQTLQFEDPFTVMERFAWWVKKTSTGFPVFVSDNPAFDWQFVNYYFHKYLGENPFGHSARRIGDFYAGLQQNWFVASKWGHLCKFRHTHNALDDAKGAASGLLEMARQKHIKLPD